MEKTTSLINIDLGSTTPKKLILKHLLYFSLWIGGILIYLFRIDIFAREGQMFSQILPIIYAILFVWIFFKQKKWYKFAFLFYPVLVFLWFIPKIILKNGKFYLCLQYLEFIFTEGIKIKRNILYFLIFTIGLILIVTGNSDLEIILSIIIFSFFFLTFFLRVIKKELITIQSEQESTVEKVRLSTDDFIKKTEEKKNEKLTDKENEKSRIKSFLNWYSAGSVK